MRNIFKRFFGNTKNVYKKLEKGQISVNELTILDDSHKTAFLMYATNYADKAFRGLSTPNEMAFVKYVLDENYKFFLNLESDQYTDEFASIFIAKALDNQAKGQLVVKKSFDKRILLINSYQTIDGAQISYYDKQLELPVSLMTSVKVSCKIVDSLGFLHAMDCDLTEFGPNFVSDKITYFIKESINHAILEELEKVDFDYFGLINHKNELAEIFKKYFNKFIDASILEPVQIDVENIDFTQEISARLQEIGFANKIKREELSNELRYEKESLDLYERKVKIHGENPSVEWNLSEAEKDKALERYLKKNGIEVPTGKEYLQTKALPTANNSRADKKISKMGNLFPNLTQGPVIVPLLIMLLLVGILAIDIVVACTWEFEVFYGALACYIILIPLMLIMRSNLKDTNKYLKIVGCVLCILILLIDLLGIEACSSYSGSYYYNHLSYNTKYWVMSALFNIATMIIYGLVFFKKNKSVSTKTLNK